jgi:hypothetical protein
MLSQTIILAITAAILVWYTFETYKIRKETSKQNTMMAEQLLIMQQSSKFEIDRQISFVDPIFVDAGGSNAGNTLTRKIINKGATVKNLSIIPNANFSAKIDPSSTFLNEQTGSIQLGNLSPSLPDKLYFEIHYENSLGHKRSKKFAYMKAHDKIMESKS